MSIRQHLQSTFEHTRFSCTSLPSCSFSLHAPTNPHAHLVLMPYSTFMLICFCASFGFSLHSIIMIICHSDFIHIWPSCGTRFSCTLDHHAHWHSALSTQHSNTHSAFMRYSTLMCYSIFILYSILMLHSAFMLIRLHAPVNLNQHSSIMSIWHSAFMRTWSSCDTQFSYALNHHVYRHLALSRTL